MKVLTTLALIIGLATGAHAYSVFCNFNLPHGGASQEMVYSLTMDTVEYRVVVDEGESLAEFFVGWGIGPLANSAYVEDSGRNGVAFSILNTGLREHSDSYTPDGMISTAPDSETLASLRYVITTPVGPGTYYFGYRIPLDTYFLIDTGWQTLDDLNQGNSDSENWLASVSNGEGPVHAPIPEPATMALVGIGSAVLALRRRFMKK